MKEENHADYKFPAENVVMLSKRSYTYTPQFINMIAYLDVR